MAQQTAFKIPEDLESVLAKIEHINSLGKSVWWEVVYYNNGQWYAFGDSNTFKDGENVIDWKYCKDILK
jgi:hypothetical protein